MNKLERETILVVDDRLHNLKLLFDLLTEEGFRVLGARDGESALEKVKNSPPDLILLDVTLPGINGFETCARLKQNPSYAEIPIVFVTGLASIEDKIQGFEVGGVDYITKPFLLEEIVLRVKTHLKIQNLQQQLSEQNQKLQAEIQHRKTVELALLEAQSNLEKKVEERTAQLKATNALLEQKIIDLQETETILQKALNVTESASRTKSDFLAKMSHELRTPLNAILGFSQLLVRDSSLHSHQQKQVEIILENSENLLGFINNILSIAQLDSGQVVLRENCFDLHYFLVTIVNFFRPKAAQKGLVLDLDLQEDLPHSIQTDERKLRQVLINLLDNAIAFTRTGYIRLKVISRLMANLDGQDEEKLLLCFAVEDTGQGIPLENLENLFEPFTQLENSELPSKGIGLGLFLCQEFVRLLGGEISVISHLDRGSIFSFEIPAYLNSPQAVQGEKDKRATLAFPIEPVQYRLLVADGMAENCQSLLTILNPLGFNVEITSEGEKCLELWRCWQPHLVLLDLHLPNLSEVQLLEQIEAKHDSQKTIAIALTASASDEEWEGAIAMGCQDFISKPFREEVVLEKLAHHLSLLSRDRARLSLEQSDNLLEELTAEELSIMPAQWLQQFSEATQQINESRLRKLLTEIPDKESPLRQKIATLLDNFRFDILNQLIDKF